jgi:acetyl-CoA carboxylase carboxyl transferase subunit alpha
MHLNYLDFEYPIADLMGRINELKRLNDSADVDLKDELSKLEAKARQLTRSIFSGLSVVQRIQLARHPLRPYLSDYIPYLFTEFDELHGDRHFSAGPSIIAGVARFKEKPVVVIGHQKGRKTPEKLRRNFGMPRPEDYRKALRLMKLAERFHLPVLTFIDTAGAYPGIGAEERNQSEAIARNLFEMSDLKTPIIAVITGEGGSGGALALGIADCVLMLQYSTYSVITPEGCASILWKNADKAPEAAQALGMTAEKIAKLKLVDEVIREPLGGAHRNTAKMAARIKKKTSLQLTALNKLSIDELVARRYARLMSYGRSA